MYSDYKSKREADIRSMINRARNTVTDTEDILANPCNLNLSRTTRLILRHRILSALKRIKQDPHIKHIDSKIEEQMRLISELQSSSTHEDLSFIPPETDGVAISQLRMIRRIRKIIHHEINVGTIVSRTDCQKEDQRLSQLVVKINIYNLIQRVNDLKRLKQLGTCRQLIERGLEVIKKSGLKDEWLQSKAEILSQMRFEIDHEVKEENATAAAENVKKEESENKNELDILFGEKKKW